MGDTRIMDLPDGRELAWLELGDAGDPAVFVLHGSPGSRLQVSFDEGAVTAAGVSLIAVDRPGYGHSSYQRDRRLTDVASDIACLADHLHLRRFSVVGISGGGPHAAACACVLPDRVRAVGIVSGMGPLADPGSEDEMMLLNRVTVRLARRSGWFVLPLFALNAQMFRRWPEQSIRATSGHAPQPDIEIMQRPEVHAAYLDSYRRASSTSALAAAQDFSLFTRDWGFRIEDIRVPVHLWHGEADRNVPIGHGRLLAARIPGARLHSFPGEGHLLALGRLEEILRTVSAGAPEADVGGESV